MTREPDIVARLRECKQWLPVPVGLANEAADEIEHLKAQIIEDCTCHNQMVENLGIEIERLRATGLELLAVAERLSPAEHSLARVQIDKARTALERKP